MAWVRVLPGGPYDLRHGYTLADVNRIAKAATAAAGQYASNYLDRLDTAWSAIVETLYAAEHPPPEHTLWHAGRDAIWGEIRDDRRHHGARQDLTSEPGSARNFTRFWWGLGSTVPSCEGRIVERDALVQIWPRLTAADQRALLALAAHGTVDEAADALGITQRAFRSRLFKGRQRFRELWHEGETPPGKWSSDRPRQKPSDGRPLQPCGTLAALRRHRRRREPLDDACRATARADEAARRQQRKTRAEQREAAA